MAGFTASVHAGQGCAITTRLVVPRARYRRGGRRGGCHHVRYAGGSRATREPSAAQLISSASATGCSPTSTWPIAEGGRSPAAAAGPADRDRGFFIEPTVVAGLDNTARIDPRGDLRPGADGESPTTATTTRCGSPTTRPTGCPAPVFSADPGAGARLIAARLRVGTVNVNGGVWYSADVPFGGYKQSGIGREMGVAGFEEYLETEGDRDTRCRAGGLVQTVCATFPKGDA